MGDGRLTLGEFTDRLDVVLAAESAAQLRAVLDDLPSAAAVVGTAAPTSFGVLGDVVLSGRWRLRERNHAATVFGDVRVDLRDSVCVEPEVRVEGLTVFGDLRVRSSPPGRRSDRSRHLR